jgi:iron complex outermembrane recepter protein
MGFRMTRTTCWGAAACRTPFLRFAAYRPYLFSFIGLVLFHASAVAGDALDRTVSLDIAPNSALEDALIQWGAQVGVQIMMDTNTVGHERTPGIHGRYRAADALSVLLNGSGLTYRISDHTVTVTSGIKKIAAEPQLLRLSQGELSARLDPQDESSAQPKASDAKPSDESHSDSTYPASGELEEVVVTGTHIRGVLPPTNLITLDQADIQTSGYTSTAGLLATLPQNFAGALSANSHDAGGLNVLTNTGYSSGVDLRGLGDSTLILLDGHRLPLTGVTATSDLSMIPIGVIESIDVLPDGASAIYGSDAIGGVVNVILKKQQDGFQTTGTVGITTQGGGEQQTGETVFGKSWAGGNVLLAFDYSNQDPVSVTERDFSQLAQSPTDLTPRTQSKTVTGFVTQALNDSMELYFEGIWNSRATVNQYYYGVAALDDVPVQQFSAASGLKFQLPRQWTGSLEATAGGEVEHVNYFVGASPGEPASVSNANNQNREQSLELQTNGPLFTLPSGEVRVAAGGGYRHEQYGDDFLALGTFGRGIYYAFSEAQVPMVTPDRARIGLNSLDLNLAVRYDHYSDVGSTTNPKFALAYAPGGGVMLRGTWGTAFKAPALNELYGANYDVLQLVNNPASATGRSAVLDVSGGNPDLRPETATVWTSGVEWIPAQVPDLKLSATYFDYDFKNKIGTTVQNAASQLTDPADAFVLTKNPSLALIQQTITQAYQYVNEAGPGFTPADAEYLANIRERNIALWSSRGVDLLSRYVFHTSIGQFTWTGNATHLIQTQQPEPSLPAATVTGQVFGPPTWKARTGVTWTLTRWTVSVFGNYTSGEIDPSQVPPAAVSSFTTMDASASYNDDRVLGGLRVSLAVLNALDRDPPKLAASSTVLYGFGFDNANYSPLGRQLNLSGTVKW